jgi:hypothetical protein
MPVEMREVGRHVEVQLDPVAGAALRADLR